MHFHSNARVAKGKSSARPTYTVSVGSLGNSISANNQIRNFSKNDCLNDIRGIPRSFRKQEVPLENHLHNQIQLQFLQNASLFLIRKKIKDWCFLIYFETPSQLCSERAIICTSNYSIFFLRLSIPSPFCRVCSSHHYSSRHRIRRHRRRRPLPFDPRIVRGLPRTYSCLFHPRRPPRRGGSAPLFFGKFAKGCESGCTWVESLEALEAVLLNLPSAALPRSLRASASSLIPPSFPPFSGIRAISVFARPLYRFLPSDGNASLPPSLPHRSARWSLDRHFSFVFRGEG